MATGIKHVDTGEVLEKAEMEGTALHEIVADLDVNTHKIINVVDPAAAQDAATKNSIDTHAASTATHGATGAIVGTTNTQTLTNKTLTSPKVTVGIEHHTALDTLTTAESGSVHTNLGATANLCLTLPQDAVAGTNFKFAVMAAYQLQVDPGAAGAIYINGAKQIDDKYIWADDEAESVELVCDGNGDWISVGAVGIWTVEA